MGRFGEFFSRFGSAHGEGAAQPDAGRAENATRLMELQQRRSELDNWVKDWTPQDRELAEQLDQQIAALKSQLGIEE